MSENISERNQKFLNSLQGNFGKYVSFLSTMARFHKYDVADLTSFAIEAPAMFTAVASKELWERHFRRKIKPNAKGVTLIKDGKETVYFDISETESMTKNEVAVNLWHFDNFAHKKFIDAVVADEKSTENATRQLARISFKDHDIPRILNETQANAKIFLDAMQKSLMKNSNEDLTIPENNPLLAEIGVVKSAGEVQETELNLEIQEQSVQSGLFDEAVDTQLNSASSVTSDADNNFNEIAGNSAQTPEVIEEKISEEIPIVEENSESTTTSESEIVEENPVEIFETNEQNNSDYDFEEMDEEEEILPDTSEIQNAVEILPDEVQQSENENSEPTENVSPHINFSQIPAGHIISAIFLQLQNFLRTYMNFRNVPIMGTTDCRQSPFQWKLERTLNLAGIKKSWKTKRI